MHSLSFTIAPGTVTGFLGPNGAGKSTTMRMIMGLDRPTSGTVTVNGKPYRQHRAPLREVGALLEASAVHPGRSARSHLRTMAATHNIKASRVSEVIEMTGLAGVATKRVGGFSLGMGQRLGIAAALLGDPRTLILDEPVNGLDPEGVQWVRQLVRALAAEGRTVFLSSHLMSEMSQTADQLLVIGRGRIIAAGPVQQVIDSVAGGAVRVRSPRAGELAAALAADGGRPVQREHPCSLFARIRLTNCAKSMPPHCCLAGEPVHVVRRRLGSRRPEHHSPGVGRRRDPGANAGRRRYLRAGHRRRLNGRGQGRC